MSNITISLSLSFTLTLPMPSPFFQLSLTIKIVPSCNRTTTNPPLLTLSIFHNALALSQLKSLFPHIKAKKLSRLSEGMKKRIFLPVRQLDFFEWNFQLVHSVARKPDYLHYQVGIQ